MPLIDESAYIDIPLTDISCIPRSTFNRYTSRYRYIRLVSLYLLCQIYQNRYRLTVRDIPDCLMNPATINRLSRKNSTQLKFSLHTGGRK